MTAITPSALACASEARMSVVVDLIRAGGGNADAMQRKTERRCLRLQQRLANTVHRHAFVLYRSRRQQPDDVEFVGLAGHVQCPGGVLAAAPGEPRLGRRPTVTP